MSLDEGFVDINGDGVAKLHARGVACRASLSMTVTWLRMARTARRVLRTLRRLLPWFSRRWFVSHSYGDFDAVERLRNQLPTDVRPIVFPPVKVDPKEFVSERLISAILASDGLVYVAGGLSERSFWVAFERDYAARAGLPVFRFDPRTSSLGRDASPPLDLATFASYSHRDGPRTKAIIAYLKKQRHFNLWVDEAELLAGVNIQDAVDTSLRRTIERGGYVVVFWSLAAAKSHWVLREVGRAGDERRVLLALLDEAPIPRMWFGYETVQLFGDRARSETQRLDDLVVRVYWLIYQNTRLNRASSSASISS